MTVVWSLRTQDMEAGSNSQGQETLQLLGDRGTNRGIVEKEDPQTYLKARFSIMSLNEMSAYKGRAAKYERVMVL